MKAIDELMHEHRAIERMLKALGPIAHQLDANIPVEPSLLKGAIEFLTGFADKCHHGKEEDLLFPAMEAAGMPHDTGPIAVMLYEHTIGRDRIQKMKAGLEQYQAGHADAGKAIALAIREYSQLLFEHIQKEDNVLYPMAIRMLPPGKDAELSALFEKVEQEKMGPGKHEAFHALLDELEKKCQ